MVSMYLRGRSLPLSDSAGVGGASRGLVEVVSCTLVVYARQFGHFSQPRGRGVHSCLSRLGGGCPAARPAHRVAGGRRGGPGLTACGVSRGRPRLTACGGGRPRPRERSFCGCRPAHRRAGRLGSLLRGWLTAGCRGVLPPPGLSPRGGGLLPLPGQVLSDLARASHTSSWALTGLGLGSHARAADGAPRIPSGAHSRLRPGPSPGGDDRIRIAAGSCISSRGVVLPAHTETSSGPQAQPPGGPHHAEGQDVDRAYELRTPSLEQGGAAPGSFHLEARRSTYYSGEGPCRFCHLGDRLASWLARGGTDRSARHLPTSVAEGTNSRTPARRRPRRPRPSAEPRSSIPGVDQTSAAPVGEPLVCSPPSACA